MIGYYRSSLPAFALSFGNDLSGQKQREALSELHPGGISYSIYGGGFRSWYGEPMQPELERVMSEGGCVVLQGETSSVHLVTEFQVEPVAVPEKPMHGAEGLYRLTLKDSSSE